MWPRRKTLRALGAAFLAPAFGPALAQFRVEISGAGPAQIPIILGRFRGEEQSPQSISTIVRADLERSGLFRLVDGTAPADETGSPDFAAARARNADAIVAGSATRLADGRFDVRHRLWDALKGVDQGGQSLPVLPADLRLAAHRTADTIYEKLTGEKGVFATRLSYVTHSRGKYSLWVSDSDGEGKALVLASGEPIISPAWSPDGRSLAYVSFESRKAVIFIQDVQTGQRRALANFKGSNSAPAFSPDGSQLAVTLSLNGGSQLYLIGRDGGSPRRITQTTAIDTEPVFTPDGKSIYFVSDRGGGPQIYRQPVAGGGAERVTFVGTYNISPALSPDGKVMAFVARQGNVFKVMVMDLASGDIRPITDTTDDESPSFAPNGRLIIYATRAGGRDILMTTTTDGKIKSRLLDSTLDIREPTWGPFGR
jgi:TolB protein